MSFKNLLLSFRLSEHLFSVLLIAILTALSIYYYRPYVLSAYFINQFYVLTDVKTQVSIDYAYTGLPQGSKTFGDYRDVIDDDSLLAKNMEVSEQGHVSIEIVVPPKGDYGHSLLRDFHGKRISLYRTANDQGVYTFHSWQCNPKGNVWPFKTIQPDDHSINASQLFWVYCREDKS